MLIDRDGAAYIKAVATDAASLPALPECPECGEPVRAGMTADHLMMLLPDRVLLIMGCEGYLCIDPKLVGMADAYPNWMPIDA